MVTLIEVCDPHVPTAPSGSPEGSVFCTRFGENEGLPLRAIEYIDPLDLTSNGRKGLIRDYHLKDVGRDLSLAIPQPTMLFRPRSNSKDGTLYVRRAPEFAASLTWRDHQVGTYSATAAWGLAGVSDKNVDGGELHSREIISASDSHVGPHLSLPDPASNLVALLGGADGGVEQIDRPSADTSGERAEHRHSPLWERVLPPLVLFYLLVGGIGFAVMGVALGVFEKPKKARKNSRRYNKG